MIFTPSSAAARCRPLLIGLAAIMALGILAAPGATRAQDVPSRALDAVADAATDIALDVMARPRRRGGHRGVPELDADIAGAALFLTVGGVMVLTGRRRHKRG